MRIGTWNLDARWGRQHEEFLKSHPCDIWLLTEVPADSRGADGKIASYHAYLSGGRMSRGQHYAAILSSDPLVPCSCDHEASVSASRNDLIICSTVLPWSGCRNQPENIWVGDSLEQMARQAINQISKLFRKQNTIWGGDLNQNLFGGWQNIGSHRMRSLIEDAVTDFGLVVPTAGLSHRNATSFTIDQIACPSSWVVEEAIQLDAIGLSDHDAYSVKIGLP